MSEQLADRLHGVIPPVVTPLTDAGGFDRESARNLYRHMLDAGVHGLFLLGSSGEGPAVSTTIGDAAVETAVSVVASQVPVLAGVLEPGTDRVIERGLQMKQLGADALVVAAPYYFPVTDDELLSHFRAVHRAVELPIFVYDIPRTTKIKVSLDVMLALAGEGTIIGAKDSSGDVVGFRRLALNAPRGFRLFTGAELLLDLALMMGAAGAVPGLGNVAPELFVQLYESWKAGDRATAVKLQETLVRLFDVFVMPGGRIQHSYAIAAMKIALMLRGVIASARTTAPFTPASSEQVERTRVIMTELGVL